MKRLAWLFAATLLSANAFAESLRCVAQFRHNDGDIKITIPVQNGRLSESARVESYGVLYEPQRVDLKQSELDLNAGHVEVRIVPSEDFAVLWFRANSDKAMRNGAMVGDVSIIYIGERRPIGKGMSAEGPEEYIDDRIQCEVL